MQTIGILGGMSWESTAIYYQHLNQMVRDAKGGLHSASVIIDSVDFAQMGAWQRAGDWAAAGDFLAQKARHLQQSGCAAIAIATNTMHKVFDAVQSQIDIPLIHIADGVCDAARAQGFSRVLFLGTQFSMTGNFLRERYAQRGIEWILPSTDAQQQVHEMIFNHLCQGSIRDADRETLRQIVADSTTEPSVSPQAVVLGCTELVMLLNDTHPCALPILDSTQIHARVLAQIMLGE